MQENEDKKKIISINICEVLLESLEKAAKQNSRNRTGQVNHYIKKALKEEGYLDENI